MTTSATRHTVATVACLAGLAVVLATGCGPKSSASGAAVPSSAPSATASPKKPATHSGPPPAPSPTATSSDSAVPTGCASSALKAVVKASQGGAAAGSVYLPVDFTNTSNTTCTMFGYPGISFVTQPSGGGSQLGRPAQRSTTAPATPVTLTPGAVAHATLQIANAGNYSPSDCKPITAHWIKIFPPNQFAAIYVPFTTEVCSAKLPPRLGSEFTVYVMRPGAGTRGEAP